MLTKGFVATATTVVALLALAPPFAAAANRFASPNGVGTTCDQASPCDIVTAINKASAFDDITVLPGTYATSDTLGLDFSSGFDPKFNLTIHGTPGARPVINYSGTSSSATYITTGSTIRDVDLNTTGSVSTALTLLNGGSAQRVNAHTSGSDASACSLGGEDTLRDSVCWYSGTGGPNAAAIVAGASSPDFNETDTLRNVTAISASGPGVLARSVTSINAGISLIVTNAFVRGGGGSADVRTERLTGTPTTPPQQVMLDHSNYTTASEFSTGDVTDPGSGTNVTTPPDFVSPATGDFRELPTSLGTLDLGTATGVNPGELDLDGLARAQGPAPDIGAYEFPVALPPPDTGGGAATSGSPPPTTTATPLAPRKRCKKKHGAAGAAKKCPKKRK